MSKSAAQDKKSVSDDIGGRNHGPLSKMQERPKEGGQKDDTRRKSPVDKHTGPLVSSS